MPKPGVVITVNIRTDFVERGMRPLVEDDLSSRVRRLGGIAETRRRHFNPARRVEFRA
jgi:hypothetical protein